MYEAKVTAVSGRTVNLRANPSEFSVVLKPVPIGETVSVLDDSNDKWYKVRWNDFEGFMMAKFLVAQVQEDVNTELQEIKNLLAQAVHHIDTILEGGGNGG